LPENQALIVGYFENALSLKQGDDLISNLIGFLLGRGEVAELLKGAQLGRFGVAVDVPALALARCRRRSIWIRGKFHMFDFKKATRAGWQVLRKRARSAAVGFLVLAKHQPTIDRQCLEREIVPFAVLVSNAAPIFSQKGSLPSPLSSTVKTL